MMRGETVTQAGSNGLVKCREVAGLRLSEERYSAGFHLPWHGHDCARFYLVLQGISTENHRRGIRECQPGTLFFHPADEVHSATQHTAGCGFFVSLKPTWLERARECGVVLQEPAAFRAGRLLGLATRLLDEFYREDSASALAMEGLMLELLAESSRQLGGTPECRPPAWLVRARELLDAHFPESLSLEEIAAAVGVHPIHLARTFRTHYRCTPGDYVRRLRLEFALRELCSSDLPLIEIAMAAGYYDQSHFAKAFKAHTGLSPTRFREAFRVR